MKVMVSGATGFIGKQLIKKLNKKGPYTHWHHTHEFEEKNGGTLIKDRIFYKVPFGLPEDLVAGKLIKKDLEKIFNYRHKIIHNLLAN
jgi:uncharacterized protein